jgi:CheY-like chemotaxis protein
MNDEIAFLPEDPEEPGTGVTEGWKILVVDDDMEIHHVTHLVLEGITFNDRSITMLSATSAGEARRVLAANPDIAVLLLDVVMETDDAGLALVPWLREELGLSALRIILRTGQPGQAPERDVVLRYDINDYRSKSELTAQKLLTATVAALRAYEALRALEDGQRNLELAVAERTRALQASEAHFRALIEAVPEGVVTIDSRGNIRTGDWAKRQLADDRPRCAGPPRLSGRLSAKPSFVGDWCRPARSDRPAAQWRGLPHGPVHQSSGDWGRDAVCFHRARHHRAAARARGFARRQGCR